MRFMKTAGFLMLAVLACGAPAGAQQLSFDDAIARLRLPDPSARMNALSLLEESGYPEAGAPIAALLSDPDDRIQRAAMYAELGIFLGTRIETRRKVALVVEIRDERPAERLFDTPWSSLPLAPVPDEVISAMLAGPTRHRDLAFRLEAIYALGLLAQVDGRSATPVYQEVGTGLAERLGDPSPETRVAVARTAGRIFRRCTGGCDAPGIGRLGDALVHSLNDPDRRVRMAALSGLGDMRWERGMQALADGYAYYQGKGDGLAYLATLARIANPTSLPLFKTALTHRDEYYRLVGGEGLTRMGGEEALAVSAALLADRSAPVRVVSAFASARAGQAAGIDRLIQALDQVATRVQAQEYLIDIGAAAAVPAAAALATGSADKRLALVEVLSVVGGSAALAAIEPLQRDPNATLAAGAERAATRIKARTQ
jgi:HEAT repeat protein